MRKRARPWLRKAEADRIAAQRLHESDDGIHDVVCFHCQQCAEKYLKALLADADDEIPRTHNLDDLLDLLEERYPKLCKFRRGLLFLTDLAVHTRYPGRAASKRQAVAALRWMNKIRAHCRALLGLEKLVQ
ncbi:MAG: HEPN domain-containing protein [Pirellulaceae bacterium]|nr:HEPN domain-containing protein [Pirellulaceae bacterium]